MDPDAVPGVERVPHGSSDDPDVVDFSANVNPELPPGTREVYAAALDASRRYPPDDYPDYRASAADYVDCEPEQVVPTAGGLAAIRLAVGATVRAGESVLVPVPSFGEYAREVRLQGATPTFVAHDALLSVDDEALAAHAMAIVCTPNNPTGGAADPDELRAFAARCRAAGTVLLVDEAFLGFTDLPSLAGAPGVVVARSLTKLFGLPGLRAGFAVATDGETGDEAGGGGDAGRDEGVDPGLLDRLERARPAWSLGTPAARVGAHAMGQRAFVAETRARVRAERERMAARLSARFDVHPSRAPFLLLSVEDVERVVAECRAAGIAVRDARSFRGLDSHVRVAVRAPEENDRLLEALDV